MSIESTRAAYIAAVNKANTTKALQNWSVIRESSAGGRLQSTTTKTYRGRHQAPALAKGKGAVGMEASRTPGETTAYGVKRKV